MAGAPLRIPDDGVAYLSLRSEEAPLYLLRFARRRGLQLFTFSAADGLLRALERSSPSALVVGAGEESEAVLGFCRRIKGEAPISTIPLIVLAPGSGEAPAVPALEAGADEVLTPDMSERERELRLARAIERARRDVGANPLTKLPGRIRVEARIRQLLTEGETFAVCYADLDDFKTFNDRYGYRRGDEVILLLAEIIRDAVRRFGRGGMAGHLGGDDFIFIVRSASVERCCLRIIERFDARMRRHGPEGDRRSGSSLSRSPRVESGAARRAGSRPSGPELRRAARPPRARSPGRGPEGKRGAEGKDRSSKAARLDPRAPEGDPGASARPSFPSLSIGVVGHAGGREGDPAEIAERAADAKRRAKRIVGSVHVIDGRAPQEAASPHPAKAAAAPPLAGTPGSLRGGPVGARGQPSRTDGTIAMRNLHLLDDVAPRVAGLRGYL